MNFFSEKHLSRMESQKEEHLYWDQDPIFVSKPEDLPVKRGPEGGVDHRSICGGVDVSQPVEQYEGSLGVGVDFVRRHERPVGQIQWNDHLSRLYRRAGNVAGVRWASGVLISRDLFISAGHAFDQYPGNWIVPWADGASGPISPQEIARNMRVNFNYQIDPSGRLHREESFPILELLEYRLGGLDYAIVRLGGAPGDKYGFAQLAAEDSRDGDMLCIIQHPEGQPKRIAAGPQTYSFGHRIGYNSIDTLGGSSGSGILQVASEAIVGIHTNGGCHLNIIGHNHGIRLSAVMRVSAVLKRLFSPQSGWIHLDLHRQFDAPAVKSDPSLYTAQGAPYLVYRAANGKIVEAYFMEQWRNREIITSARLPRAAGTPTGYALFGNRTRYVSFLGQAGQLHQLWWDGGGWRHVDLHAEARAPAAQAEASPHIAFDGNSQQLYYIGADGGMYMLTWAGRWFHANLSAATNAARAAGRPAVVAADLDSQVFVVYRGPNGRLHMLIKTNNTQWRHEAISPPNAPPAKGDPKATLTADGEMPRVYYQARRDRLVELRYWAGQWLYQDLTAAAEAPPIVDAPALVADPGRPTPSIYYRDSADDLRWLEWEGERWKAVNIHRITGAAPMRGAPAAIAVNPLKRYLAYRGKDERLHLLEWNA
jgi:hypothetical protein